MGTLYKTLSPAVDQNFQDYRWSKRVDFANFIALPTTYWHRQKYTDNSTTALTFFNAGSAPGVTNLNQGRIPAERPFWMRSIGVRVTDISTAGALSSQSTSTGAASQTTIDNVVKSFQLLDAAYMTFQCADRTFVEGYASHFPAGVGIDLAGVGVSGTIAAAAGNNGSPLIGNRHWFEVPVPLLPDRQLTLNLNWLSAVDLQADCYIEVFLYGTSVLPYQP